MKLSEVVTYISETTELSKRAAHDVICKYQNMMRDATSPLRFKGSKKLKDELNK